MFLYLYLSWKVVSLYRQYILLLVVIQSTHVRSQVGYKAYI